MGDDNNLMLCDECTGAIGTTDEKLCDACWHNQNQFTCMRADLDWFKGNRRERFAARFLAELVGPITFPQSVEDQLHAAGVKTEDFEAYAADVAVGFADALIERLDKERGTNGKT